MLWAAARDESATTEATDKNKEDTATVIAGNRDLLVVPWPPWCTFFISLARCRGGSAIPARSSTSSRPRSGSAPRRHFDRPSRRSSAPVLRCHAARAGLRADLSEAAAPAAGGLPAAPRADTRPSSAARPAP